MHSKIIKYRGILKGETYNVEYLKFFEDGSIWWSPFLKSSEPRMYYDAVHNPLQELVKVIDGKEIYKNCTKERYKLLISMP